MKCNNFHHGRDGSALLIVLGFLSFMMVSAVSFAVYMRIEREASSNFRQTTSSRHLLNTALARAMDEVDSELRITDYQNSDRKLQGGGVPPIKFPTNWTGRVLASALPYADGNALNARVLSLDSLAYIPAAFVNDVRRHAVPNKYDADENDNYFKQQTATSDIGDETYEFLTSENWHGAKWRPIYQPLGTFEGEGNANSTPQIGRYAYVCVNLSDMLDANKCRAYAENMDTSTNRLSIGHLFDDESKQEEFDRNYIDKDRYYQTVADFYTCMAERNDPTFAKAPQNKFSSPFRYWTYRGADEQVPDKYFGYNGTAHAQRHVLATDSIVKAEPRATTSGSTLDPLNLNTLASGLDLSLKSPLGVAWDAYKFSGQQGMLSFYSAMRSATTVASGENSVPSESILNAVYGALFSDYLDSDCIPRFLCLPSMERTPQICKIMLKPGGTAINQLFKGELKCVRTPRSDDENDDFENRQWTFTFKINDGVNTARNFISAQTIFPFIRDSYSDTHTFYIKMTAGVYITLTGANTIDQWPAMSGGLGDNLGEGRLFTQTRTKQLVLPVQGQGGYKSVSSDLIWDCGNEIKVEATQVQPIPVRKSDPVVLPTGWQPKMRVVCMAFIYCDNDGSENNLVDMVPCPIAGNGGGLAQTARGLIGHKFSFAPPDGAVNQTEEGEFDIPIEYTSYECPDPRFNYRMDNWVAGTDIDTGSTSESTTITEPQGLAASLVGQDGRDGDFYQVSKNTGNKYFHNVGELGFFPRPFKIDSNFSSVNVSPVTSLANCYNYQDFYRTIRLYDHGTSHRRDNIARFMTIGDNGAELEGPRVNPLTDQNLVLSAAINATPLDYYWYGQSSELRKKRCIYNPTVSQGEQLLGLTDGDWKNITNAWFKCLQVAKTCDISNLEDWNNVARGTSIATSYRYNLYDIYGDASSYNGNSLFNWYSDGDLRRLFKGGVESASLSKDLYECYRKMLYSYTLDNFSDRQQLFLYILAAEAVSPSATASTSAGVRSLAGGKAVALVWRDPYPTGYTKIWNGSRYSDESWTYLQNLYKGDRQTSSEDCLRRVSPWFQYSLRNQRGRLPRNNSTETHDEFGTSSSQRRDTQVVRETTDYNKGSYHEQRVLFFKILDN